jgi:hypothetical protein
MVSQHEMKNAWDMCLEEVADLENITKQDIQSFKKRMNGLLDKLEEDAEDEDDEDDDEENVEEIEDE